LGTEYNIRYRPPNLDEWATFVARLDNPISKDWPAFVIDLRDGGIYFCDNGRSEAAVAFRRIIDEALKHAKFVEVAEG
jgi:hypothetical protein